MTIVNTYGKAIISTEIEEISKTIESSLKEKIKEKALEIAFEYLQKNAKSDPVTLARASFYIALKEYKCVTEKNVNQLINNNGKRNRWWLYIIPLVEKGLLVENRWRRSPIMEEKTK